MKETLTDREFWLNYWESKTDLIQKVPDTNIFSPIFEKTIQENSAKSAIELGGFPGHFCIYIKKHFNIDVSLFDFVIHQKILTDLLTVNNLKKEDIKCIEGDILTYSPLQRYDFVFSLGLIEHFQDTQKIIQKHLEFLNPGGSIFISLPNFRGLNGLIQKSFDSHNYSKHNIKSMDVIYLREICKNLNLEDVEVSYFKNFSVWLENPKEKSFITKALVKALWISGIVFFKVVPLKTRFFSPYIVIKAKKPKN